MATVNGLVEQKCWNVKKKAYWKSNKCVAWQQLWVLYCEIGKML